MATIELSADIQLDRIYQEMNLVSDVTMVQDVLDRILSFDCKHKRLRRVMIKGYHWREYPFWTIYTNALFTLMPIRLACICKEAYMQVKHWMNPYRLTLESKLTLLDVAEQNFNNPDTMDVDLFDYVLVE